MSERLVMEMSPESPWNDSRNMRSHPPMTEMTTSTSSKTIAAAKAYAAALLKSYGPCTVCWAVATKFQSLTRGEFLAIAQAVGIKKTTASNEHGNIRGGRVTFDPRSVK